MEAYIKEHITESYRIKQQLASDPEVITLIREVAEVAVAAYRRGNKIFFAGNGGSAADAQHLAGEFVSRFYFDRPGLPAQALTVDTSILTAIGNDYGYERLFARQIQANAQRGDLFVGISTSGNSPNILEALAECRKHEVTTIGLTGANGGKMAELCEYCIRVPSLETPRIQEAHILIGHILCAIVENELFGGKQTNGSDHSCRGAGNAATLGGR